MNIIIYRIHTKHLKLIDSIHQYFDKKKQKIEI